MNLQQALQQLEELGTAQNRKVYARHGVNPNMFGVSYANLNKLAKSSKRDHPLALELVGHGQSRRPGAGNHGSQPGPRPTSRLLDQLA